MKLISLTSLLAINLALAASVFAGTNTSTYSDKRVVTTAPEPACFGAGFDVGFFAAGILPRQSGNFNDSLGGGALAEYFFNEHIGLQASYAAFAAEGTLHAINGDLVVRAPIQSICLAPYVLLGGGVDMDGANLGEFHAGAGVEARLKVLNDMAIFADGTYNWHGDSNRDRDYTIVRFGLKLHL